MDRNDALMSLVESSSFKRVFEFAGASGLLAGMMLMRFPNIEYYLLSDFSKKACELAETYLSTWIKINLEISKLDMTSDLDKVTMSSFDMFITTSMEHLPKGVDIEIIERIPKGTYTLFSLTTFPKEGHPHPFRNEDYIRIRYENLLCIKKLELYEPLSVFLLYGEKR